jgi:hypothetical protein
MFKFANKLEGAPADDFDGCEEAEEVLDDNSNSVS